MLISGRDRTLQMTIPAPPSKSVMHRELIVRFLMGDREHLDDSPEDNDDIKATRACLRALGNAAGNPAGTENDVILPCRESGSTLRFMIPVAAAFLLGEGNSEGKSEGRTGAGERRIIFGTEGRLYDRPLLELEKALMPHGIKMTKKDASRTIEISGKMTHGKFEIDGGVSSQYISGLLMALPFLDGDSEIEVPGTMKSKGYIDLTLSALSKYEIPVTQDGNTFTVKGNGYKDAVLTSAFEVEGDWSNGAFLLCLKNWSGINVTNLDPGSKQGDKVITEYLDLAGKDHGREELTWECGDIPDIVPYMATVAPFLFGKVTFNGIGRLRIKESDRVKAVREQLAAINVKTEETEDSLTVYKFDDLRHESLSHPIRLSSYHDHRMAMCAVLIAVILKTEVEIDDVDCLKKSFPQLLDLIKKELSA